MTAGGGAGPGVAGAAAGVLAGLGGVALLRRAWRSERPLAATWLGWALLAAAAPAFALGMRGDKAVALALLLPSLAGYALVAANAELRPARRRPARPVRAAPELPDRPGEALWRGVARTLMAGPLAGAAAVLAALAWALRGLGSDADRAGAALLLVPLFWAAGLTWATTDRRLARIAGGLGALTLISAAAVVL